MIPAEAVEAALDAFYANCDVDLDGLRAVMAILEAAAPHMLAAAWDEGAHFGGTYRIVLSADNPYRSTP